MTMQYVRKTYNVPAKRGMQVVPKVGRHAGQIGYIRKACDGLLVIVDVPQGRYGWWSLHHPDDLDYRPAFPPNTEARPDWNTDDLYYALSLAADFLENEEWPEDDCGAQVAAYKEAAKRVRRMAKRLPPNTEVKPSHEVASAWTNC